MFSGIVETVGTLVEVVSLPGARRIAVASELPLAEVAAGQSIAVDGVCLTVTGTTNGRFLADVVRETLERTTLGGTRRGTRVNLERALVATARLDGHLVQGHVDGVGHVRAVRRAGHAWRVALELPAGLERFVALKGSIALDGVSLTVAGLAGRRIEVALVPETLRRTTLGGLRSGAGVNVEVDLVARYLDRLLGTADGGARGSRR